MKSLMKKLALTSVLFTTSFSAMAGTTSDALADKYKLSEKAFAENDVQILVEQFYAKDVYVVGEGSPAVNGIAELTPILHELVAGAKKLEMTSERADYQGEDTIYDFVNYRVFPSDGTADFNVRSLLVWKKTAGEWRVKADMYTFGNYQK